MRQALVTGGTGFIGRHLVQELLSRGDRVRVLTRSIRRGRRLLPPQVDLVEGDVASAEVCASAMRGVDVVFHLAAAHQEPGIPDRRYREVHVDGTLGLLEAAQSEGVERFVHCSTVGVLGDINDPPADETYDLGPEQIYEATKCEAESLAVSFHTANSLPVTVARPAAAYGPGDKRLLKLFKMIQDGRFVMLGKGEVSYHMIFVDDLVRGLCVLAEHPNAVGETFILAGEKYVTLNELAALIARELGVAGPRFRLPVWPFLLAGAVAERICIPLGINPPIYRRRVAFFTKNRAYSIDKAKKLVGFTPTVGLRDGIGRTIGWYRAHGHLRQSRGATRAASARQET